MEKDVELNPNSFTVSKDDVAGFLHTHDPITTQSISYRRLKFLSDITENKNETPKRVEKASMLYINLLNRLLKPPSAS